MAKDDIDDADRTSELGIDDARRCDVCGETSVATFTHDDSLTKFCAIDLEQFDPDAATAYAAILKVREKAVREATLEDQVSSPRSHCRSTARSCASPCALPGRGAAAPAAAGVSPSHVGKSAGCTRPSFGARKQRSRPDLGDARLTRLDPPLTIKSAAQDGRGFDALPAEIDDLRHVPAGQARTQCDTRTGDQATLEWIASFAMVSFTSMRWTAGPER